MWIKKSEYEKLQREVADSKVERYYPEKCEKCKSFKSDVQNISIVDIGYACHNVYACDHLVEHGGDITNHPWVRCRKRPEGRKIEEKKGLDSVIEEIDNEEEVRKFYEKAWNDIDKCNSFLY